MQKVNLHSYEQQRIQAGLARLLGGENFTVTFQVGAETASFDLARRHVTLPIWNQDTPTEMIDWLTIHEIGHGLYTDPKIFEQEDFAKKHKINPRFLGDVINVVEDIRINKLLRLRFPGATKDFFEAYRYRYNHNHYGSKESSVLNDLGFIDRLNVHMKAGHCVNIHFAKDEVPFVKESEATMTCEEVVELSKKIALFLKSKVGKNRLDKLVVRSGGKFQSPENEEKNDIDLDDTNDYREEMPAVNTDKHVLAPESIPDEDVEEKENDESVEAGSSGKKEGFGPGSNGDGDSTTEENENVTNSAADEDEYSEQVMTYNHEGKSTAAFIQNSLDTKGVIQLVGYNTERIIKPDFFIEKFNNIEKNHSVAINRQAFAKWYSEMKTLVRDMVNVFESRKAASAYRKTGAGKTGIINPNKLYNYKIAEDIFKKTAITQKEKNHCFVMLIDSSESMKQTYTRTVHQALMLAMFCREIDVPFKIFGYTTSHGLYGLKFSQEDRLTCLSIDGKPETINVITGEMISSDVSKIEFEKLILYWYTVTKRTNQYLGTYFHRAGGGTPTTQAMLAITEYVIEWIKKSKVEICNFIDLTDGRAAYTRLVDDTVIVYGSKYFKMPKRSTFAATQQNAVKMFRHFAKEIAGVKSIRFVKYYIHMSRIPSIDEKKDDTYDNYFAVSSASFVSNDVFRLEKDGKMAFTMGKKRFFVKNLANYLSTTVD